jgi:hypothetical protein
MPIGVDGRDIGETVECVNCGTPNQVLAEFGSEFDISTIKPPENGEVMYHPARLTCSNCGAVLGVRDAYCPKCYADVRTGAAVVRPPEQKRGLGVLWTVLGVIVVLIVLAVVAVAMLSEDG